MTRRRREKAMQRKGEIMTRGSDDKGEMMQKRG